MRDLVRGQNSPRNTRTRRNYFLSVYVDAIVHILIETYTSLHN